MTLPSRVESIALISDHSDQSPPGISVLDDSMARICSEASSWSFINAVSGCSYVVGKYRNCENKLVRKMQS